jgi:hypothetical protein
MPKTRSRKRAESQRQASERGRAVPSYIKEVAKELASKSRKVARNRVS